MPDERASGGFLINLISEKMQSEYLIKKKVVLDGRVYRKGDKVKIPCEIAEKFPWIFEKQKSKFKKSKNKRND